MSDDPAVRGAVSVELICPECGNLIEVKDPTALVRSLHLVNVCKATAEIVGGRE